MIPHGKSSLAPKSIWTQFKLVEAKMKTAAARHVKRDLNHLQANLGQAGTQLRNATATVDGQKKFLPTSQQILDPTKSRQRMPPRSSPMTRSAVGTAGVNGVHQRQRTVDASSGLSKDVSSLDEDGNLLQQRCYVGRCRVRSCSGSR